MAYVYMKEVPYNTQEALNPAYELKREVDSPTTTEWVIIPDQVNNIVGTISVTGTAVAYAEVTTSPFIDIVNDTAVASKWPFADITVANSPSTQSSRPVSAIRGVVTGVGTAIFTLRVQ